MMKKHFTFLLHFAFIAIIASVAFFPIDLVRVWAQEDPGDIDPPILNQNPPPTDNGGIPNGYYYGGVGATPNDPYNSLYGNTQPYGSDAFTQSLIGGNGDGTQASGVVNGQQNNQGGNTGAAIAKGVQSAASCISSAQAIRLIKEAFIKASPATYTKVGVTNTIDFSQTGEVGQVSFNAIAYCLINAIIEYITQATIAWVNSGFDGNPAFVDDPGKFFGDFANTVGSKTIRDIANDPSNPFGPAVAQTLVSQFNGSGGGGGGSGGLSSFLDPKAFTFALTDGQTRFAEEVNSARSNLRYSQGNTVLPATKPGEAKTTINQTGEAVTTTSGPKITTPSDIEAAGIKDVLNMGRKRIAEAKDFDSVVQHLMNAIIKIALSAVLQLANGK